MAEAGIAVSMSVDNTLGAVFIGFAVACCVYGVLMTQVFTYFRNYFHDRIYLKLTVLVILLLETADQAFIGHLCYHYAISDFAHPESLLAATVTWSLILQLTVGSIVGAIVKASFGMRVWRFSGKNYIITGIIMILTFGQLGTSMVFTVKAFGLSSVFGVFTLRTLGTVSLALGVATDIITAAALCFFLLRLRTGLSSSDSLVTSLVLYAINTGALTSAVSLTTLLLFNFAPSDTLYFIATYFIVSKMYAISYMATLNTRRTIRGRGTDRQGGTTTQTNLKLETNNHNNNNNTNLFHLGTRIPSMGPGDYDYHHDGTWDADKSTYREDDFPLNTFAPAGKHRILV